MPYGRSGYGKNRPMPSHDPNDPTEAQLAGCARRIGLLLAAR